MRLEHAKVAGKWIKVVPDLLNGITMSAEEFRDNLWIRLGLHPQGLIQTCDGCGWKLAAYHDFKCKKGGLVTIRHNNVADECDALCVAALTPSEVAHKTLINYGGQQAVTGDAAAETRKHGEEEREKRQGDDKDLTAQEKEERGEKGVHRLWRHGMACIFEMRITDSDAARNRGVTTDKVLEKNEREKKKK